MRPAPPPGEVVGLVPAAGRATRAGHLACSKEIHPLGFGTPRRDGTGPRVACDDLLESMADAAVDRALILLAPGKWDIIGFLGRGERLGLPLGYVPVTDSPSVAHTLAAGLDIAGRDATLVVGFPDITFHPGDAVGRLLAHLAAHDADVALGVFPAEDPRVVDVVDLTPDGRVAAVTPKPAAPHTDRAWILAAWRPTFTRHLERTLRDLGPAGGGELHLGHVLQAGIDAGLRVDGVAFPGGGFCDVGTPARLRRAMRAVAQRNAARGSTRTTGRATR